MLLTLNDDHEYKKTLIWMTEQRIYFSLANSQYLIAKVKDVLKYSRQKLLLLFSTSDLRGSLDLCLCEVFQ